MSSQGHLEGMIGKPSGYIESLPKALRNRIAYLRELQDQHDELAEKHHEEQIALQRKYERLWGKHSYRVHPFKASLEQLWLLYTGCSVLLSAASHITGQSKLCQPSNGLCTQ